MTTDPQAPEIAALVEALRWALPLAEIALENHRYERIKNGHNNDLTFIKENGERWVGLRQEEYDEIIKARKALSIPLPIAPQETMREILAEEYERCDNPDTALIVRNCQEEEGSFIGFALATMQRAYALGQSHPPATVEADQWRRLATALGAHIEAIEMHCQVNTGAKGEAHAAEGRRLRDASLVWIEITKKEIAEYNAGKVPATVERELVEALIAARGFIKGQRASDNLGISDYTLGIIDKALATASQPVDGEARK